MDSCKNRVLVVGGIPEPVGGVTSFVFRLAENNMVTKVADLYPSKSKVAPCNFDGQLFYYKGLMSFLFALMFSRKLLAGVTDVHFNFSRSRSLIFFLIPFLKKGRRFHLTLHHGVLDRKYPSFLFKYLLSKIDIIYCLSEKQFSFYQDDFLAGNAKLKFSSSYVPIPRPSSVFSVKEIDEFVGEDEFVVASGNCTKIYNHDWIVRLFNEIELDDKLVIFLYGAIDGEYLCLLQRLGAANARIKLMFNVRQETFGLYLSRAKLYIRANSVDSFGIAVADAVSYGVTVMASDVCNRYPGSYLFKAVNYESFVDAYLLLRNNPANLSLQSGNSLNFSYHFGRCREH